MLKSFYLINTLINQRQRRILIIVFFLLFIGMALEFLGIGAIYPIISSVLDQTYKAKISELPFLSFIQELSHFKFLFLVFVFVILFFILKALYLIYLSFRVNKFLANLSASLASNLFENYINYSYVKHKSTNSSVFIRNIQVEMGSFMAYLSAYISLMIEVLFLFAIFSSVIFIEPLGALLVSTYFIIFSSLYHFFSSKKLKQMGINRQIYDQEMTKTIHEGFEGIKTIKSYNIENRLIHRFSNHITKKGLLVAKFNTISQIPKYYLELITIIGMTILVMFLLEKGYDLPSLISTLGVFAIASFKLTPSINKILLNKQTLKYSASSIELLVADLNRDVYSNKVPEKNHIHYYEFNDKINLDELCFSYSNSNKFILEGLNLVIKKGERIGIIGESGVGKSTFIDVLIGLLPINSGRILLDGIKINTNNVRWKNFISYVPQDVFLFDDTIKNNIILGDHDFDETRFNYAINESQLNEVLFNLKEGFDTRVGERGVNLSGGQRQRVGIARALYKDSKILILDESTSSLDTNTESLFNIFLNSKKNDLTILFITHRHKSLKGFDKIYNLKDGKLEETHL